MPTIKIDLTNDNIKKLTIDTLKLFRDLLNDERLSDELRGEYGKKLEELGV